MILNVQNLGIPWQFRLELSAFIAEAGVWSLVEELRSFQPGGMAKKKKKN